MRVRHATRCLLKLMLPLSAMLFSFWFLLSLYMSVREKDKEHTDNHDVIVSSAVSTKLPQAVIHGWPVLNKSCIFKTGKIFPDNAEIPMTVSSHYIIPNQYVCSGFLKLKYVIIVHSAVDHHERRARLRRTWANQSLFPSFNSRVVFLLGSTPNKQRQKDIFKENDQFGDIVQGNFIDHYTNLTLKAVMGLRWITENCPHADYVIKSDDDVFVNIRDVNTHVTPILAKRELELVCSVEPHAFIFREGDPRKQLIKWMMPESYFSGLQKYPMPFCYGYAAFYKTSLASHLFEMAKSTPFYRLDDVYVYGILASKVKGLVWRDATKAFHKTERETEEAVALIPRELFLVGTAETDRLMDKLWEEVNVV